MTFQSIVRSGLDYQEYRYGRARKLYRGPKPDLSGSYIACLGGSETYGRFAQSPWPAQLEEQLEYPVANFGQLGAGAGFFLKDPVLLESCSKARACVISITGAHLVSNRLFSVYPRRNQRLQGVSEMLEALYPEIDFGIYRFALHMLVALERASPDRFRVVEVELRNAWIARMRELLNSIETVKALLWLSPDSPDDETRMTPERARDRPPGFVNRQMINAIRADVSCYVEYVASDTAMKAPRVADPNDATVSMRYPSDRMHEEAAQLLAHPIFKMCNMRTD